MFQLDRRGQVEEHKYLGLLQGLNYLYQPKQSTNWAKEVKQRAKEMEKDEDGC